MDKKHEKIILGILLIIGLSPFLFWIFNYLGQDVWYDEMTALREYATTDFKTIFTNYKDLNHHILLDLLNHILFLLLGVHDIYEALDYTYVLRALQMVFAFITVAYSYLIVKKFFNKKYAILTVAILTSCIPFLNFSLQLRGYNMSMMWMVLIIYHTWSYIDYRRKKDLILCSIFIFFCLYTLPSNLYHVAAFGTIVLWEWIKRSLLYRKELTNLRKNTTEFRQYKSVYEKVGKVYVYLGLACIVALIFVYLAYIPIIESLKANRYIKKNPSERIQTITVVFPTLMYYFFSKRWLLLLFIPLVIWMKIKNKRTFHNEDRLYLLFVVLISPFVFSYIHNKLPFQRLFIPLAPVFAIILTGLIAFVIERIQFKKKQIKVFLLLLICIYAVVTSFIQMNENQKALKANHIKEIRVANAYRNFYLANNYTPHKVAKTIAATSDNDKIAFLVDQMDRVSLLIYLEKYNIRSYAIIGDLKVLKSKNKHKMLKPTYHSIFVQKSIGKYKEVEFWRGVFILPLGLKFNNYMAILKLSYNYRKEDLFLLSGYHDKAKKFVNIFKVRYKAKMKYNFNLIDTTNFVYIHELKRVL